MNTIAGLGYGGAEQCEDRSVLVRKREWTYTERVDQALENAAQQVADLTRMKEIFAKHPEFEELLTLVQRGRI